MTKKTTTKKTTTNNTISIAKLSRALNIDAKKSRAKMRRANIHAHNVNDDNRHSLIAIDDNAKTNEHKLSTICEILNLNVVDVRKTLNAK